MISLLLKEALAKPELPENKTNAVIWSNDVKTSTFLRFSNILTNPLRTYFEEPKELKEETVK